MRLLSDSQVSRAGSIACFVRLMALSVLLAGSSMWPAHTLAQNLFWTDTDFTSPDMGRATTAGTGAAVFPLSAGTLPEGIAIDAAHGWVYRVEGAWSDARVLRSPYNLGGTDVLVSGGSCYRGIALDVAGGFMYWTSSNGTEGGRIRRAGLNGSSPITLLTLAANSNPRGIGVDPAGFVFWADFDRGEIGRATLGGGGSTVVVNAAPGLWGVAVDPIGKYVYYTDYNLGTLSRWPMGGGTSELILSGLSNPTYVALEPNPAPGPTIPTLYWNEAGPPGPRLRKRTTAGVVSTLAPAVGAYGGLAIWPVSAVDVSEPALPLEFALETVGANPSVGPARLAFLLPRESAVRLRVFDVRGREMATLADGVLSPGRHEVTWGDPGTAGKAPAGLYFARFEAPGVLLTRRIVLAD